MGYYDALIAKWQSVAGADTATKLTALNAETVAVEGNSAPVRVLTTYLWSNGLMLPIKKAAEAGTSDGAYAAVSIVNDRTVESVDMTLATTQGLLADLVAKSLVSQPQADALVALGNLTQPWWQANGYRREINMGDIVVAGLDTTTGYSTTISAPTSSQFNVTITVTVTGPKSVETTSTFANTLDADYAKYFAANCIQNMMARDASLATFG